MSRMLEVEGLRAGYGEVEILRGVDLTVHQGEIVALLGANGAGKSTLTNNLSGIFRPFAGSIRFKNMPLTGLGTHEIVGLGLAQVPEGRRIFPNLTVRENLLLGGYRRGRARSSENFSRILELFPKLHSRVNQYAGTLSGGEQQILAIGRGLMAEPELLILDEPSLGLSPLMVEEMFAMIETLNNDGLTILLIEQNLVQSLSIADRGIVLENGVVSLTGTAAELLQRPDLKASYLGM